MNGHKLRDGLLTLERQKRAEGFCIVAGVDEAGRGPLAGPVVAAAVAFPAEAELPPVDDSKRLSAARREQLYDAILAVPGVRYGIAQIDAPEIDRINILEAAREAMRRAVELMGEADFLLVDGLPVPGFRLPTLAVVKGDAKSASIAAASILAKVTRDRYMLEAAERFPEYGFERHKGYGTAAHLEALRKFGPCELHRRSFAPVRELEEPPPEQLELW